MEEIVTIIEENLIWIIVGAVLLVMIIIGYYAEKTNFGRKKPTSVTKKENNEPVAEVIEEEVEEPIKEENEEPKKEAAELEKTEVIDVASVKEKTEENVEDEEDVWKF